MEDHRATWQRPPAPPPRAFGLGDRDLLAVAFPTASGRVVEHRVIGLNDRHQQGGGEGDNQPLAVRKDPMNPTPHRSPLRPFAARLGLAALLVLALFTLSRCRLVNDRLTGIDLALSRKAAVNCIVECQQAANQEIRTESVLHVSRVKACGGDADCLGAEQLRHQGAVHDIQARRKECVGGCHHQGGGQAGN